MDSTYCKALVPARACSNHSECRALPQTSCIASEPRSPSKRHCLCGNNKPPVNGFCSPGKKGKNYTFSGFTHNSVTTLLRSSQIVSQYGGKFAFARSNYSRLNLRFLSSCARKLARGFNAGFHFLSRGRYFVIFRSSACKFTRGRK